MKPFHHALALAALAVALVAPVAAGQDASSPKPGEVQEPKGTWQVPGEIQQPKGTWQVPGEIQVPRGIEAVKWADDACRRSLTVVADALFDFDESKLSPQAEETLRAIVPELEKLRGAALVVEGHTDSVGSDAYNQTLSEQRAASVRAWLVAHGALDAATPVKGFGETRPIAPNTGAGGADDPRARQRNRRVEIVADTCGRG